MTRSAWIGSLGLVALMSCGDSGKSPDDMLAGTGGQMIVSGSGGTTPPNNVPTGNAGQAGNTTATGGSGAMQATGGSGAVVDAGGMQEECPTCTIQPACQGFALAGLKYSPGGDVLPNKCMPFNPTTNNPYAVRCIDAIPEFKTKFPGDQFCILPPPPDKGIQVGLHPQGNSKTYWEKIWAGDYSTYENPPEEWILHPGDELTQNYRTHDSDNTTVMNYYRTYFRMRTGSHHNIITMHDSTEPDGWIEGGGDALPGIFDFGAGTVIGILGGQQRADDSTPVTLEKPPEDQGVYLEFPPNPAMLFNMHHFNITDGDVLREGWSNIWWESDATKKATWYMGLEPTQTIGLAVGANESADLHYSWTIGEDTRLLRAFGHRHFWTSNFSTWIEHPDGKTELAYQSYDWSDMPTYRYDSVVKNPPLNPTGKTDGAMSGVVTLKAGDKMHFNCHIDFTDERAALDKHAPAPGALKTLRFANEAYNGEMCIQFGNVVGPSIGLPSIDDTPLPDFAKAGR
jgi:hypothetical protein